MQLKGKRFLVVGGAGFIGSHIVDELVKREAKLVTVWDNLCNPQSVKNLSIIKRHKKVLFRKFDIQYDIPRDNYDGIFVLSALWLSECQTNPYSAISNNIMGLQNIIEHASKNKPRIVFSSSASVYGNAIHLPMREDHPFNNKTVYGATKIFGEQLLRAYHHMGKLDYVALRYMNVYGPRQHDQGVYIPVILKMIDCIEKHQCPVIYGTGEETYDFIHVKDVAHANILAMTSDVTDRCYNVGTGLGLNLTNLAYILLGLYKRKCKRIIYRKPANQYVTKRVACTIAAERDLKFTPSINIIKGLKDLIKWRLYDRSGVRPHHRAGG